MTNEKAPERIWIQPAGLSFFYVNSNGTYYATPDVESIGYVREDLGATVRAEEQRHFINNVAAVLGADDVEAFTALIMKAKASPDLNSETRSALKSEAEIRAEEREAAWRDAMEIAKAEAFERRMAFNVYDALQAKLTENRKGEG